MYNLGLHMSGVDLSGVPWRWIQHWSRLLEADLMQRRLNQSIRK